MSDFQPTGAAPELGTLNTEPTVDSGPLEESLGNAFLKNIPEVDRRVLEPYVKQWDAGVTKKFQSIHDQYRPYKDLGVTPDELREALDVAMLVNSNPQYVYEQLAAHLQSQGIAPASQSIAPQQQQPTQAPEVDPRYLGLNPEFVNEFSQMREVLMAVGQFVADQQRNQTVQAENQQFDAYMAKLHKDHGDFNDEFVAMKISQGMGGPQAVKAWNELAQGIINSASGGGPKPPVLLSGRGSVPSGAVDPRNATSEQSKAMVADMLAKAAAASQ